MSGIEITLAILFIQLLVCGLGLIGIFWLLLYIVEWLAANEEDLG